VAELRDLLFFFQAEDGIRVFHVTGVQTCALPISYHERWSLTAGTPAGRFAGVVRSSRPTKCTSTRRSKFSSACNAALESPAGGIDSQTSGTGATRLSRSLSGCRRRPISVVAVEIGKDRATVLGRWKCNA